MRHKPYRYFLYLGLRLVQGLIAWLPRKFSLALAEELGRLAFFVARRERRKTLLHLTEVYQDEKSPAEICELGQRVFIHFARVAADVLRLPHAHRQEIECLVEGTENLALLNQLLSEGRGVILLTAHFGNWELMGAFLRFYGYEGAVVGRRIYYERFNEVLLDLRESVTLKTIYQDASPREFLKILNQNQILGILADQDVDRLDGIFVPFFGRPAYTLTAPVKLALATGAPILPTFLVRTGDRYRLLVGEPIRVEMRSTREETLQEYTARWSSVIEEKIRAYPDQWVWMHRRWKTREPSTNAEPVPVSGRGR